MRYSQQRIAFQQVDGRRKFDAQNPELVIRVQEQGLGRDSGVWYALQKLFGVGINRELLVLMGDDIGQCHEILFVVR